MYRKIDNKENFISLSFFVFNVLSLLFLFFDFLKPGIFASIYLVVLIILDIPYIKIMFKGINSLFTIFILINIFSGFYYLLTGLGDASLFFYGFNYNIMPMVMFYIGSISAKKENRCIIRNLIISNFLIVSIGIILYYFEPNFYKEGYVSKLAASGVLTGTYYRFPSYLSSMAVGNLTVVSIPLLFMMRENFSKKIFFVFLGFFIIGSILTMQRSSFIMLIFVLIVSVKSLMNKKSNFKKYIKIILSTFVVSLFLFFIYKNVLNDTQRFIFESRVSNLGSAISERSNQWETAIDIVSEYPLGTGVGSVGHKAASAGVQEIVSDGNYFRILAEVGIQGLSVFLILNCLVMFRIAKRNRYLLIALIVYLFQAIGTNVFDIYYTSFIYWFILGYSANYTYKDVVLYENNI